MLAVTGIILLWCLPWSLTLRLESYCVAKLESTVMLAVTGIILPWCLLWWLTLWLESYCLGAYRNACCDRNHTALVPTVMPAVTGIILPWSLPGCLLWPESYCLGAYRDDCSDWNHSFSRVLSGQVLASHRCKQVGESSPETTAKQRRLSVLFFVCSV